MQQDKGAERGREIYLAADEWKQRLNGMKSCSMQKKKPANESLPWAIERDRMKLPSRCIIDFRTLTRQYPLFTALFPVSRFTILVKEKKFLPLYWLLPLGITRETWHVSLSVKYHLVCSWCVIYHMEKICMLPSLKRLTLPFIFILSHDSCVVLRKLMIVLRHQPHLCIIMNIRW